MTAFVRDSVAPPHPTATAAPTGVSPALLTDKYELTMLQAALADGTAHRHCVFEVFTRRLPTGRRYGVLAGTGRFLEALQAFRFAPAELDYLGQFLDTRTLDFLADYRFTGSISGYAEGEVFFPGSPVLEVEGSFAEAVLLETLILSILNYDSAVASAASRMTSAAGGRPCLDMGARRANEHAAIAAARAAVIAGFAGTSNLAAGMTYAVPTIGTSAHAFTLVHDNELAAFRAQVESLGVDTTLLVDTFDVPRGIANAVAAAGPVLGSIRLDSGDLGAQAAEARRLLDALGAKGTKIVVTSDLDEHAIAALAAAPVDSYGVGTALATGSGAPTCGMVYKLVARTNGEGVLESVAKTSPDKPSLGGRKGAARRIGRDGRALEEVIATGPDEEVATWAMSHGDLRPLQVPLVVEGAIDSRWVGVHGVETAVARHRASIAELPVRALRLSFGNPVIRTVLLELR
jgi:nicotinate phosphoribosyltransferase